MTGLNNKILPLFISLILLKLTACTQVVIDEYRQAEAELSQGDAIVILGRRHSNNYETEPSLIECLEDEVSQGNNAPTIISEQTFLDQFYPFFEPRTAPMTLSDFNRFRKMDLPAAKLKEMNLRYLIWVDGNTETTHSVGSISCALMPGGGCLGFGSWDKESGYETVIWDLKNQAEAGRIHAGAKGTSYMPAVVVPIPLIARVQTEACKGLGKQIRQFFSPDGVSENVQNN